MIKAAFVGLGTMGLPMALNLHKKAGAAVTGYDLNPERLKLLTEAGGSAATDSKSLYADSEVIFLSLMTNDQVRTTVAQILEVAKPGTVIADLGSTSPSVIRELYAIAKDKGVSLVDCPVSGGDGKAIDGTLVIMCGGDKAVFDRIEPLLRCMGATVTYMGASGNGCVAKFANNIIVAIILGAISEGFAYGVKGGLDPTVLHQAIRDGSAASFLMELKIPKIIKRDFYPNALATILQKDLSNVLQFAEDMGVGIPLTEKIYDYYGELDTMGRMGEDHCNLVRIYERDMGIEVK